MTNTIDVKFAGLAELRAAKYLYQGTNGDDCLRAMHTNFYNSAYSYTAANMSSTSITDPGNAFNRNDSDYAFITSTRSFGLLKHRIRVHAITARLASATTSLATGYTLRIRGFNESNSEFTYNVASNFSLSGPQDFVWDDLHLTVGDIRRGWVDQIEIVSGTEGTRVYQLYVYGEIIEETQAKLPPTAGATTIEDYTDSFIGVDPLDEGNIVKDGSLRISPRRAHTIRRQTLSGTYDIPDDGQFDIWNFDPDGANRTVNLPRFPVFNRYLRINNLNGAFQIRVNDSDHSTLIQNLSNADGPNTLEAVWGGTQWIVTT